MDILTGFGFDWIQFTAQIVNFIIVFILLKKLLYKPVITMLEERKTKIADGLKNAEQAEKMLTEATEKEEEIISKAQLKAKNILEEAKTESIEIKKTAEEETKIKVEKMLKEAREQIEHEAKETEKRLEVKVGNLAISFLKASLKGLFGVKEQESIMKQALQKIKKA